MDQGIPERSLFFDPTVNTISRVLNIPVSIWLLDEQANRIKMEAATKNVGRYLNNAELSLNEPCKTLEVFKTKRPFQIHDIENADLFKYKEQVKELKIRSVIIVPLLIKKTIVGILYLYIPRGSEFSYYTSRLIIDSFSEQIASTFRQIRSLEALNEMSKVIGMQLQEPQLIIETVLGLLKKLLECDEADFFYLQANKSLRLPNAKMEHFASVIADYALEVNNTIRFSGGIFDPPIPESLKQNISLENMMIWVPVRVENSIKGVLWVRTRNKIGFDEHDDALIEAVSNQAAFALQNSNLIFTVKEQSQALTELNALSQNLVSIKKNSDSRTILQNIADIAHKVLKADLVELYEYQQNKSQFVVPQVSSGQKRKPFPLREVRDDDVIFQLIKSKKAKYVVDSQIDHVFMRSFKGSRKGLPQKRFVVREGIISTAVIPLRISSEIMGLMFANYREPQNFPKEQRDQCELFANYAAIAIKNVRRYAFVNQRRKALVDIGQKLTAVSRRTEKEVLELVYEQASKLQNYENLSIALYDEKSNEVRFALAAIDGQRIDVENETGWEPRIKGKGKTERIIKSKKFLYLPSQAAVKKAKFSPVPGKWSSNERMANSWLGVPMMLGDKVLGVIANYDYGMNDIYSVEDIEILQAFAAYAAIAIDSARLNFDIHNRLEKLNQRLLVIVEIGKKLISTKQINEENTLKLLRSEADKVMDTSNMLIALYREEKNELEFKFILNDGRHNSSIEELWKFGQRNTGKCEWIVKNNKAIVLHTKQEVKEWYKRNNVKKPTKVRDWSSWLGVPMAVENRVIGVIAIRHLYNEKEYNDSDLQVLISIASQAAIAIDNARLYERINTINRRLKALIKVGQKLSTKIELDEKQVLELLYEQASSELNMKQLSIALYDEERDLIRFEFAVAEGKQIDVNKSKGWEKRRGSGGGKTRHIIKTKAPLCLNSYHDLKKWEPNPVPPHRYDNGRLPSCWLGVPMSVGSKVLGVIATYKYEKDSTFDKDDVELLQALANRATISLANTKLVRELKELLIVIADLEQEKVRNILAKDISHKMNNHAGYIAPAIVLLKELANDKLDDPDITRLLETMNEHVNLILTETHIFHTQNIYSEEFSLKDLVRSIIDQLSISAPDVKIEFECKCDNANLIANRHELRLAIFSVIENSVHATSGNIHSGEITIRMRKKRLRKEKLSIVEILIEDNGCGIPTALFEAVFNINTSYWEDRTGSGYGLWSAQKTISAQEGSIIIKESEIGKGTTFLVRLPVMK
ncbi:MAG: GAF domain-containing protein [Calditrichia bacterium]